MGIINLPSLLQRVRVDTSDMDAAETRAKKFGASLKKSLGDIDFKKVGKGANEAARDFEGLGGVLGKLKIPLIAAGAGAAVGSFAALGAAAAAVTAQFGPMVGVVGAAPGLMLAMKTSVGVLGEAFKQLEKNDPSGMFKRVKSTMEDAGKAAIPGIVDGLKDMAPLINLIRQKFIELGSALGGVFGFELARIQKIPNIMRDVGTIMDNNRKLATTFTLALEPIVNIFKNIMLAAAPMTQGFADDFLAASESLSKMSNNVSGLSGFFDRADTTARRFVGSMFDIGVAVKNTMSIAGKSVGIDFVGGLESGARKMKEFTQSVEGQNKIAQYFKDAGPIIKEVGLIIRDLTKDIVALGNNQDIVGFLKIIRTETLPAFNDLANGVGGNALPAVANLATAFAKFNSVLAFSPLLTVVDVIAKMVTAAADLISKVPGLGTVVASLLLMKTAVGGIATVSKFVGLTSLVTSLGGIGAAGTAGAKGIAGFVQGMRGASGESATLANKLGSGLKTALSAVGNGAKDAVKWLGTSLKSAATGAATAVSTLAASTRAAAAALLSNMKAALASAAAGLKAAATQAMATARALAATAAANLKAAWSALASATAPLIAGLKGAALAAKAFTLSLMANPIFLIITAVVALVAAIVLLYKKNETFRNFVNAAWQGIKDAISAVVGWIVNTAWPWLQQAWESIKNAAKTLWDYLKSAWDGIKAVVSGAIDFIKTYIAVQVLVWSTIFSVAMNTIKTVITAGWDIIKTVFIAAWTIITGVVRTQWNLVTTLLGTGWNLIKGLFSVGFNLVTGIVKTAWNGISAIFTGAWKIITTIVTSGWELIKTLFTTAFKVVKALVTGHWDEIPKIMNTGMGKAKAILGEAWNSIKSATSTAIGGLIILVRDIPGKIISALGNIGSLLYNAGQRVVQGLIDGIRSMFGSLSSAASSMASTVSRYLPGSPVKEGPLRVLNNGYAGKQIVKMVNAGVKRSKGIDLPTINRIKIPRDLESAVKRVPRAGEIGARRASAGSVDNSRVYQVTINETQGPSTVSSLTNRLRMLDLAL